MRAVADLSATVYLDECAPPLLVSDLGGAGYDVVHAWDVGNRGIADEVHLRWAASTGRALFTFDIGDFQALAARWTGKGEVHTGIILSIQTRREEYGQLLK
jgi:predicted nuclease of predicted toxin-antitoxin system